MMEKASAKKARSTSPCSRGEKDENAEKLARRKQQATRIAKEGADFLKALDTRRVRAQEAAVPGKQLWQAKLS